MGDIKCPVCGESVAPNDEGPDDVYDDAPCDQCIHEEEAYEAWKADQ